MLDENDLLSGSLLHCLSSSYDSNGILRVNTMNNMYLNQWFDQSSSGGYLKEKELDFYRRSVQEVHGEVWVQMGMASWPLLSFCNGRVLILQADNAENADVCMQPDALAWTHASLDGVLLPHVLSCCSEPDRILAEVFRALKPEGRLILTEFNPHSLWGIGAAFDGKRLPEKKRCLPLPLLKRKAKATGFNIERGRFMGYAPWAKQQGDLSKWAFIESAGNRWWPHAAAVYGLVLVKRTPCITPLPEYDKEAVPQDMVLGVARAAAD